MQGMGSILHAGRDKDIGMMESAWAATWADERELVHMRSNVHEHEQVTNISIVMKMRIVLSIKVCISVWL